MYESTNSPGCGVESKFTSIYNDSSNVSANNVPRLTALTDEVKFTFSIIGSGKTEISVTAISFSFGETEFLYPGVPSNTNELAQFDEELSVLSIIFSSE